MSIKVKNLHVLLLLISSFVLFIAYVTEYIMGLFPCSLCIYQRFPHLILIVLSIISISGGHVLNKYYLITIIFAIIIASYHLGLEKDIFRSSFICKRQMIMHIKHLSVLDFSKMIYNSNYIGQCSKPVLTILGLSMTELNLILNLFLVIICIKYRGNRNAKTLLFKG